MAGGRAAHEGLREGWLGQLGLSVMGGRGATGQASGPGSVEPVCHHDNHHRF